MDTFSNAKTEQIHFRRARGEDVEILIQLILEHGPNEWNHLPKEEIAAHLDGISRGQTFAVLACNQHKIIGMASFNVGDYYPQYEDESKRAIPRGYIAEVVVDGKHAGKGLGTRLLEEAKTALHQMGVNTIYVKRHEENLGSAGMMRKAGFEVVDIFPDSIRTSGSRKTAVERFKFE